MRRSATSSTSSASGTSGPRARCSSLGVESLERLLRHSTRQTFDHFRGRDRSAVGCPDFATRLLGRAGSRLTRRIRLRLDGGLYRSRRERQRLWAESGISLGLWSGGPGFDPAHLSAGLVIGRYCSFGARLTIATQNHPCDRSSTSAFFYEPSLGAVPVVGCLRIPPC